MPTQWSSTTISARPKATPATAAGRHVSPRTASARIATAIGANHHTPYGSNAKVRMTPPSAPAAGRAPPGSLLRRAATAGVPPMLGVRVAALTGATLQQRTAPVRGAGEPVGPAVDPRAPVAQPLDAGASEQQSRADDRQDQPAREDMGAPPQLRHPGNDERRGGRPEQAGKSEASADQRRDSRQAHHEDESHHMFRRRRSAPGDPRSRPADEG